MVWGHTKIPGGECHRHKKRVWKRNDKVWTLCNFWYIWHGCQQGVQTNYGSSFTHVQWFSCQNNRADDHDIIIMMSWGSLMQQRKGSIKGEHNQAWGLRLLLLLSSGCFDTSFRVFTKPQTLYLSCLSAPWVGSISWMYSVVCFIHKHASLPIWRTLS